MIDDVDSFEHAGLTVKLVHDDDSQYANPREDSNLGVMFCEYPRYTLGDEDAPDPRGHEVECDCFDASDEPDPECAKCEGTGTRELSIVDYLKAEHGARVILPLFVYEHSGITMSAGQRLDTGADNFRSTGRFVGDSAGWDTSSVGVIFDTAETRKECCLEDWDDERIAEALKSEVELYAAYLEGHVYGYVISADDDDNLDSCWGFLEPTIWQDDAYIRVAAREAAEHYAATRERERTEAAYWAARDVPTVTTELESP
jgi:hypothetical protein